MRVENTGHNYYKILSGLQCLDGEGTNLEPSTCGGGMLCASGTDSKKFHLKLCHGDLLDHQGPELQICIKTLIKQLEFIYLFSLEKVLINPEVRDVSGNL